MNHAPPHSKSSPEEEFAPGESPYKKLTDVYLFILSEDWGEKTERTELDDKTGETRG